MPTHVVVLVVGTTRPGGGVVVKTTHAADVPGEERNVDRNKRALRKQRQRPNPMNNPLRRARLLSLSVMLTFLGQSMEFTSRLNLKSVCPLTFRT